MVSIIQQEIMSSPTKSISYARFIELALYDPHEGYYMKQKDKIGKEGDFYTSSTVHRIFAKVFVPLFVDICNKENLPFAICEVGGGNGQFAKDLLEEWQQFSPETFSKLNYYLVETSPYHRQRQAALLKNVANVSLYESIEQLQQVLSSFEGILFSNELFDSFPVHVVQYEQNRLYEIVVSINENGDLIEKKQNCTNREIEEWLCKYGPSLNEKQRIEIPLYMNAWFKKTAHWLKRAAVITIDYGYTRTEWAEPERLDGSLRGYFQHQLIDNLLRYPSEMDLTSHVHLDAIVEIGEEVGLVPILMLKQDQFLLKANILNYLQDHHDPNPFSEVSKQNRAIRSLISDGSMSKAFTVIVQNKGLNNVNKWILNND